MTRNRRHHRRVRGFTLIEMIISIVLISVLAVASAPLLRLPLSAWLDATRRADLTQSIDTVNSKLTDDLRRALPNSVRVQTAGTRVLLETLEVRAYGRHRHDASGAAQACPAQCSGAGLQDALQTACTETCFTSLGPLEGDPPVPGSDWIVVNPLTPAGAVGNPYFGGTALVAGGIKSRLTALNPAADGNRIDITSHAFPALSAIDRFYVVSTPVTWDCNPATGLLTRRWGYAMAATQPVAFAAATPSAPLATDVQACSIRYQAAGSAGRGGVVQIALRLRRVAADSQMPEVADLLATYPVSEGP